MGGKRPVLPPIDCTKRAILVCLAGNVLCMLKSTIVVSAVNLAVTAIDSQTKQERIVSAGQITTC